MGRLLGRAVGQRCSGGCRKNHTESTACNEQFPRFKFPAKIETLCRNCQSNHISIGKEIRNPEESTVARHLPRTGCTSLRLELLPKVAELEIF